MENRIFDTPEEDFINIVKTNTCIKGVLFTLGYTTVGNSWGYSQIKERMKQLGLTAADFKGRAVTYEYITRNAKVSTEELFSTSKHPRNIIRKRIIEENLIEYKCAICGISEWMGNPISLELDHINGVNNDNRLENLRFLCPNCHSQTITYGAKNKNTFTKEFEITDDIRNEIKESYLKYRNDRKVCNATGYKQKLVKMVVDELELRRPNMKFVIRYDKDMNEIKRYPSISQLCRELVRDREVKTVYEKTCKCTFFRNKDKFWLNSYWKIIEP